MTVAELIELLRAKDGDAIVRIEGCCGHCLQMAARLLDDEQDVVIAAKEPAGE